MISSRQRLPALVAAGLLSCVAWSASAATPAPVAAAPTAPVAEAAAPHPGMKPAHDGPFFERMKARRAQHQAELKKQLALNPAQESAWTAYAAATQPPARPMARTDRATARAEFAQLTTPERLDRLQARQTERATRFAERAEATRSFYAALTPAQQKTFDAQTLRHGRHGERGHHGHHGPRTAPAAVKG